MKLAVILIAALSDDVKGSLIKNEDKPFETRISL